MKKIIIAFFPIALLFSFFSACTQKKNKLSIDVNGLQHQCVHRLTDVLVYDILSPPVASRIYAYSNLAYYEALRFKENGSFSFTKEMKGFGAIPLPEKNKQYNFTLAAIKSFFSVAKALSFSKDSLSITEKDLLIAFQNGIPSDVYKNSTALGDSIATVILNRAAADNYKKTRGMPKYSVFKEPGKWQQTPPDYADATEPNWKLIIPLLPDSASQCKPDPPPSYDLHKNSRYYQDVMEVYTVNKKITPLQDTIAHYWDDNSFVTRHEGHFTFATKKITPGGHWMGIVSILCKQTHTNDIKTAQMYALTASAIFDGFICCWDEKYRSRMVRPITVIRDALEPNWTSLLQTPAFPEYPSAHSVITAAASAILTLHIGDNISFHDTTERKYLGLERSFNSIRQAADEAAISRLYGGIHYRTAIEEGKKQGQQVGKLYNSIFKFPE